MPVKTKLLIELGFAKLSNPLENPISYLDEQSRPIRHLSERERMIARVACMALFVELCRPDSERIYVLANTGGLASTGIYDHGTYWIKAQFLDMSRHGYRMVKPIGLTDPE